jgi:PII-like signaling protein
VWQTIRVYTRRTARVHGHALYSELTRWLREAGAAGATTILGDWGFSSDEPPRGDVFGKVASDRPTYTVVIDRPEQVAALWPIVDELTVEHGIVTSLLVPGYRERAGDIDRGSLNPAVSADTEPTAGGEDVPGRVSLPASDAGGARSPWVDAMLGKAHEFAGQHGIRAPVVRVTLADGEQFFLRAAEAGPQPWLVTLYPHLERYGEPAAAVADRGSPPRAVIVPHASIAKIELLAKAPPGTRSMVGLSPRP